MSSDIAVRVCNGIYVWARFPMVVTISLIPFSLFPTVATRLFP